MTEETPKPEATILDLNIIKAEIQALKERLDKLEKKIDNLADDIAEIW